MLKRMFLNIRISSFNIVSGFEIRHSSFCSRCFPFVLQTLQYTGMSQYTKILLTGLPSCGKTTAIMQIVSSLDQRRVAGFYTEEIREGDKRKGFRWARFDGPSGILAHTDIKSPYKVGKYHVDLADFEKSVLPILDVKQANIELFIIDEIGKMECLSRKFIAAVHELLASDKPVLATVAQRGAGFISEVKSYPGVTLLKLASSNRDEVTSKVIQRLSFLKRSL
jgi:nucleoside-triphosphatase